MSRPKDRHRRWFEDAAYRAEYEALEEELALAAALQSDVEAGLADVEPGRAGQLFEDFLHEQGALEETTERAVKRVIAFQLARAMQEQRISKREMARRLAASRTPLDRLLDPENGNVTLATLTRAARVLGRSLRLELN